MTRKIYLTGAFAWLSVCAAAVCAPGCGDEKEDAAPIEREAGAALPDVVDCQKRDDGVVCEEDKHCFGGRCVDDECGDGILSSGEFCDDGNLTWGDGCGSDCLQEMAGCTDGVLAEGEECDDGNWIDDDKCSNRCVGNRCGNRRVDADEECDDGNTVDDDSCSRACKIVECRNGRLEAGEECDDGNNMDRDTCTNTCKQRICGNGKVEPYEECDDGNTVDKDACTNACTKPVCGNGTIEPGEVCDGPRIVKEGDKPGDRKGCSADCQKVIEEDECEVCMKKPHPMFEGWDYYALCFDKPSEPLAPPDDPFYTQECMAIISCAMKTLCVQVKASGEVMPGACYCGSAEPTECVVNGPANDAACGKEFRDGARSQENAVVQGRFTQTEFPVGPAYALLGVMYQECRQACAPHLAKKP